MKRLLPCLLALGLLLTGCDRPPPLTLQLPASQGDASSPASSAPAYTPPSAPRPEELSQPEEAPPLDEHGELTQRMQGELIEIGERLFVAQTNDIYINVEEYEGKTVRYQGLMKSALGEDGAEMFYVIRYGPGCCGYDSNAGFEVAWAGEYPPEDSWVEATGTLEIYGEGGWRFLRVSLSSLEAKEEERGAEYVYR